ncbi:L-threonylcarbamoyladenylate synthase [Nonomuraea sp. NPDC003201]
MTAPTSDIEQAAGQEVPETARLPAERFWPGPLTLVLRRSRRVPLEASGGLETVAVRVPDHPVAAIRVGDDLMLERAGALAGAGATLIDALSRIAQWLGPLGAGALSLLGR